MKHSLGIGLAATLIAMQAAQRRAISPADIEAEIIRRKTPPPDEPDIKPTHIQLPETRQQRRARERREAKAVASFKKAQERRIAK